MTTQTTLQQHHAELAARVAEAAARIEVPGVAVGIYHDGEEDYVYYGVTSVKDPLPVDETTLFQIGSTGKTLTDTAIMVLVERGRVELSAPVMRYIPDFTLQDPDVAESVRVLQLLNHTSGWTGDYFVDDGYGDDALARFVGRLHEVPQEHPLGERVSYSNSALSVAGRIIEIVTGKNFEAAIQELVFDPIGMTEHFYYPWDIMTRRYSAGHARQGGELRVTGWYESRNGNPQGGNISATARDQIRYARFHMSDGWGVLRRETLEQMQRPTTPVQKGGHFDAIGIGWMLREIDGVSIVSHGGSTSGFQTAFEMVPSRDFAVVVHTNASHGLELHKELLEWVFDAYLGLVARLPDPLPLSAAELAEYAGEYETQSSILTITVDGDRLLAASSANPDMDAEMAEHEDAEPTPPLPIKILPDDGFLVIEGQYKGLRGRILRGDDGRVNALDMVRVFRRRDDR